jgi:LacI family transcriptional regulator
MGAAVVNELQRRGLRVPEDVSVLGFGNTSTSRDLGPKITPHRLIERSSA